LKIRTPGGVQKPLFRIRETPRGWFYINPSRRGPAPGRGGLGRQSRPGAPFGAARPWRVQGIVVAVIVGVLSRLIAFYRYDRGLLTTPVRRDLWRRPEAPEETLRKERGFSPRPYGGSPCRIPGKPGRPGRRAPPRGVDVKEPSPARSGSRDPGNPGNPGYGILGPPRGGLAPVWEPQSGGLGPQGPGVPGPGISDPGDPGGSRKGLPRPRGRAPEGLM